MRDMDWTGINRALHATGNPVSSFRGILHESQQVQQRPTVVLADEGPHDLLRWTVGHESAPPWTAIGSVRHSDVVDYEFRCYMAGTLGSTSHPRTYARLAFQSSLITVEGLNKIATLWTTKPTSGWRLPDRAIARATFLFQTYCDPLTWQIRRVLKCMLWPEDVAYNQAMIDMAYDAQGNLESAILSVQQLQGRDSVWYALQSVTRALSATVGDDGWTWASFDDFIEAFGTLLELPMGPSLDGVPLQLLYLDNALLRIRESVDAQSEAVDLGLERDTRTGNSMIAIRSPTWPETCPKFCLYVLSELADNSEAHLHQLLEEARSLKNYYGEGNFRFTRSDWQALHRWRTALSGGH